MEKIHMAWHLPSKSILQGETNDDGLEIKKIVLYINFPQQVWGIYSFLGRFVIRDSNQCKLDEY